MIAARAAKKKEAPQQEAPQQPAPAPEPQDQPAQAPVSAAAAGPTAVQKMEQDDIDAIIAKRAAEKESGAAAPAPAQGEPSTALGQSAIDSMIKNQDSKPDLGLKSEEPEQEPEAEQAEPQALGELEQVLARLDSSSISRRKLSLAHIVAFLNSMLILVLLAAVLTRPEPKTTPVEKEVVIQQAPEEERDPAVEEFVKSLPTVIGANSTWGDAERAYAERGYATALRHYSTLLQTADETSENIPIKDYLRLRIAQCLERTGKEEEAMLVFQEVAKSKSPICKASAHHEIGRVHARRKQYLLARAQAFAALSALESMENPPKLALDCRFLIGRVMTEKALAFFNPQDQLHWQWKTPDDIFAGFDEMQLRKRLKDGYGRLGGGFLGAEIIPDPSGEVVNARCRQVSLEEVFKRLHTVAKVDIGYDSSVSVKSRKRSINLWMNKVAPAHLAELAAGQVGLICYFDGRRLAVFDPRNINSVAREKQLYIGQARRIWHRLDAAHPFDERIAHAHLGLGSLLEASGNPADLSEALNEYATVMKLFDDNQLVAPLALLRKIGIHLRTGDIKQAREGLQNLIDQYPHFRADETWLQLAEVTYQYGAVEAASRVFRELYEDNLSVDSRAAASHGVGKCAFELGDYRSATHWLKRYLGLSQEADVEEYRPGALLLMGKSYARLGETAPAITYLHRALDQSNSPSHELDVLQEIADAEFSLGNWVNCLGALNQMENLEMSPEVDCRRILTMSRTFRAMDLPERSIDVVLMALQMKTLQADPYGPALELEYARALRDHDDVPAAIEAYLEVWPKLQPGKDTWLAGCEMAQLCLEAERVGQAVSILEETVKVAKDGDILAKAKNLLVRAYLLQDEFQKASQTASAGGVQ